MTCLTYKCVWHDSLANHWRRRGRLSVVNACDMTDTLICETWLISESNSLLWMPVIWQTHWYVGHDSIIWWRDMTDTFIYMWDMTQSYDDSIICIFRSHVWHDSSTLSIVHMTHWRFEVSLMNACDVTHSYVWHDSSIRVTWLMHMCDINHPYVWHDSLTCVTLCDMSHSYVRHDSSICVALCDMTHSCVWHYSLVNLTHYHGWKFSTNSPPSIYF